jgi:hypothetical protein
MGKATYEFRYVSTKQKVQLVLCKAFVIMLMLMFLTMLAVKGKPDYGKRSMIAHLSGFRQRPRLELVR